MKITVVVPVRNEEHSIRLLLQGLLDQTLAPSEIVIVDGGSSDATQRIVEEHARQHSHLHLIRESNALPGKGRNVGAAYASSEWLAFTDAGVVPATDWLSRLAGSLRDQPETDVVYGGWEPFTDTFFTECAAIAYANVPAEKINDQFIQSPAIFSSLMRRSVWSALGGFSEELRSAEDLLFINRIEAAGFKVSYAPRALVRWSMQPTWWRTFRRFVTYSRHNMRAGLWKQWQRSVLARYGAQLACAAVLFFLTRWWPIITAALFLIMLLARAIAALMRNRTRYPAGLVRNIARLIVITPLLATIDAATVLGVVVWLIGDKFVGKANLS
jgi:glycosyltransferase involved in cell wall biosynthesis